MPPFRNIQCPHCTKSNKIDLAELPNLVKGVVYRGEDKPAEEFTVTCQYCGRKFKVTVKGGK